MHNHSNKHSKPSMKTKYLRLSEHYLQLIFLVLRALQMDDLTLCQVTGETS